MTRDEELDERKKEGNAFMEVGDYENAIRYKRYPFGLTAQRVTVSSPRYYTEALKIPQNKLNKDTRDAKRGAIFSNRSLAHLRMTGPKTPKSVIKALQDSGEAIKCRPTWPKGHFRMGEALIHLGLSNRFAL